MLSTVKAMPMNATCVSLSSNSPLIASTSTLTTMRSTNPTVLIAISSTSASHGESRRIDTAMQDFLSTPWGSEHGGRKRRWLGLLWGGPPSLPLSIVRRGRARSGQLRLVAFLPPGLGERLAFPVLHRRVGDDVVDPRGATADLEAVSADAERNRGVEGVGCRERRAGQPRSPETVERLLEKLPHPGDVPLQRRRHRLRRDAHADIHRAVVAQRPETAVHLGNDRLREGARLLVLRPDLRMPVGEVERDPERIPDRPLAPGLPGEQHRHLPGRREGAEIVVVVGPGKGFDPVLERDPERLHQQPRPQRPARIVPVGGDQRVAHGPSLRHPPSLPPAIRPINRRARAIRRAYGAREQAIAPRARSFAVGPIAWRSGG